MKTIALTQKLSLLFTVTPIAFFAVAAYAGGPSPVPALPAGVSESQAQYLQQQTQQSNIENQQMQQNLSQEAELQNNTGSSGLPMSGLPSMQAISDQANGAIETCAAKRLNGILKNYAASAKCSNARIISLFKSADYPYMDLINGFTAKRMSIAKKLDKKSITEEQAKTEIIDYLNYIVQEERNRSVNPD